MDEFVRFCPRAAGKKRRDCDDCVARSSSFCAQLDDRGLAQLRQMSVPACFMKNCLVFEQGARQSRIYMIVDGMAKLYRLLPDGQRQVTCFLGPGDLLGGIKTSGESYCTVQATTNLEVCAFERRAFLSLLEQYPKLCLILLAMATEQINAQHDHVTLLGCLRGDQRLATFLLMAGRRLPGELDAQTVTLPMSRADIADYLGQTVESVSRVFGRFRDQGYIEMPRPSVVMLKNLPALYDLAGLEELPQRRAALGH